MTFLHDWVSNGLPQTNIFINLIYRCITLRYITPLRFHFMATTKLPILAHRIVKFIKDLKLDDHPVFFHVFSNGGSNTYSYILRELNNHKNSVSLDIRGTIFDSAPCPRRLLTSYNALISIFSNLKMWDMIYSFLPKSSNYFQVEWNWLFNF